MTRSDIALVGFMGSGKSTVGPALAARLGVPFHDLDAIITARVGSIASFFRERGEASFRALEREVLRQLPSWSGVVALGGGTAIDPVARGIVESRFHTVFLDTPLDICAARVGPGDGRPLWKEAQGRFDARQPVYATARTRVDGSLAVDDVVEAIIGSLGDRVEHVDLGDRSYPVTITRHFDGALDGDHRVLSDTNVERLWSRELSVDWAMPAGESNKTLETWRSAVDFLIESRCRRSTIVAAFGGGVVGDLVGFASATVNRGTRFVQIPTTTLAMVDSSVGGKTAVNHPTGKNLIGAFHQPSRVWMNTRTLSTLPPREARAGLAEVVKMAVCLSPPLFEFVEANAAAFHRLELPFLEHAIAMSVRIKADVVRKDERETGVRAVLNAGHTVGHAIERVAGFGAVLHGEAVSMGIVAESAWGERRGLVAPGLTMRIARLLRSLGLPTDLPHSLDSQALFRAMQLDKKASADKVKVPLTRDLGSPELVPLPISQLSALISDT